ncbi:hypothetical protein [Candidatus Sulfurimonas baltica]|uniref:Leucine-rich repeat domain-containing protein n=1 Tax=Candidatus Sulfurimonas baltica TaxID=2740404 RepID=A0A7S7LY61_9BACT|nr:hypothetical protein [Candidatus Sulfurimonas baltica]QOY53028.1 hypothetical protein HUE88_04925 [Candidatus Sulfurimonas baltica]
MQSDDFVNELLDWANKHQVDDILKLCDIKNNSMNKNALLSLQSLDLSSKKLHLLPVFLFELVSIENLNLSHNQLKELPQEITQLKKLKNLDISWNHIVHNIDFLPSKIILNSAWNRPVNKKDN